MCGNHGVINNHPHTSVMTSASYDLLNPPIFQTPMEILRKKRLSLNSPPNQGERSLRHLALRDGQLLEFHDNINHVQGVWTNL